MKIAYIEPIFGASGDMILSAFIDAGLPAEYLYEKLKTVIPVNFSLEPRKASEHGISATMLNVKIDKEVRFRGLDEIKEIFLKSDLEKDILERSIKVFEKLAEIESKIHNIDKKQVHFHELGAIDTIIDIVGFFIARDFFKIDKIYVSKIPFGNGHIKSEHGFIPVPAFATLELLRNFPVYGIEIDAENITPTAAAIINTTASFSLFPEMQIRDIGYGLGQKSFISYRNMLRITIGEQVNNLSKDKILILEFNVDDMTAELLANFMEKVMNAGAKDCFFIPIVGKKGRPATLVTIMMEPEEKEKICDIIFSETTTIGIRYRIDDRDILKREEIVFNSSLGNVKVKKSYYKGLFNIKPEFEDLKRISQEKSIPLKEVYEIITREMKDK